MPGASAGRHGDQRSPVRTRRCPATVRPRPSRRGRARSPASVAASSVLGGRAGYASDARQASHPPTERRMHEETPRPPAAAPGPGGRWLRAGRDHFGGGRPGRPAGQLPGHPRHPRRQGHPRPAAQPDRVAVADGDRDAVRHRRRRPGGGRRQQQQLPGRGTQDRVVGLPAESGGHRRLQARPDRLLRRPRGAEGGARQADHPGPPAAGGDQAGRHLRPARPARPGHRPPGRGREADRHHAGRDRQDHRGRPARAAADLLPRAGQEPVLGHIQDLHRPAVRPARHEEHRRRGRQGRHRLPAAVGRVRGQGRPRPDPAGRHQVLRPVGQDGRGQGRLGPADGGEVRRRGRAGRRRRLPLGPVEAVGS
jgi:hypothetical protein